MDFDLIIFDADGTLVERDSSQLLGGVAAWFERYHALPPERRPQLAIATNQGGVGTRYRLEQQGHPRAARYPRQEQIEQSYGALARRLLPDPDRFYVAFAYQDRRGHWTPVPPAQQDNPRWSHAWRKPRPGMLRQAMEDCRAAPDRTLMVGDSPDDQAAAAAAGTAFQWADDFFSRRNDES